MTYPAFSLRSLLAAVPAIGLAAGMLLALNSRPDLAGVAWVAGTVPVLAVLLGEIVVSLRRGDVGLDIIAALSMSAALVFGEELAAAVVALMYAGGQYLENFAERRARREMTALLDRVPRTALRYRDGGLEEVDLASIVPGDRLLIRQGDAVPVDGVVSSPLAVLNESALTGEALPVQRSATEPAMSGSTNAGEAFELTASRPAAESTYAGIVRLVEAAQRSKAPMARLADRFALFFLAATVVLAGGAWLLTGDPIRAVAVLVIATPCPLILAVPVAIVAGLSRAAGQGILIKGGKALEGLAAARSLVIDKTGTLTTGQARIIATHALGEITAAELLRLAASIEQASKHALALAIVEEARSRGVRLSTPGAIHESPGEGIAGVVDGVAVVVGGVRFVESRLGVAGKSGLQRYKSAGAVAVAIGVGGRVAGVMVLADTLRTGTEALLAELRRNGVQRIVLASGDRKEVADAVTAGLGLDSVRADLTPDEKVLVVLSERKNGPVIMAGDGVNDAPALAAADVGVAMGARGAAAAAEVADVVLLVDSLARLAPAIAIARRSMFIARESVYAGIGLSLAGMFAAAFGYLEPIQGAVLQEVIDVAVILNALRALRGAPMASPDAPVSTAQATASRTAP